MVTSINTQYLPPNFVDSSGNLTVPESVAAEVAAGVQAKVESLPPAEAQIFLALLHSSNLAPSSDGTYDVDGLMDRLDNALDKVEKGLEFLAQLMSGGGNVDLLSRALVELAGEQRKQALEDRLSAREAAKAELHGQADKMREAATAIIATAVISAVISIVGSLASMYGAGKSQSALKGGGSEMMMTSQSQAINMKWQGISGLGSALGGMVGQIGQGASKNIEAEGSDMAAQAEYEKGQADIGKEVQQAVDELIHAIINFLKELKEAQANQMQSLTRL